MIGDTTAFSDSLQQDIITLENETRDNTGLIVNIAANYGAKWDITQAARKLAEQVQNKQIGIDDITEEKFGENLCLAEQGDVDLLIRTGGELRISNYLLWQCAYAEFYFTPIFWPDFDEQALDMAIAEYQQRNRRFGSLA